MRLPQISGKELVKRLMKLGFVVTRQRGSHIRIEKNTKDRTIKKGTLTRIVKDSGITPEEIF